MNINKTTILRGAPTGAAKPQPAAEPQPSSVVPESTSGAKAAGFSFTPALGFVCWAAFGGAAAMGLCAAFEHLSVFGLANPAAEELAGAIKPTAIILAAFGFGGIGWLLGYISASLAADARGNAYADAGVVPREDYVEVVGALAQCKDLVIRHHVVGDSWIPATRPCPVCVDEEGETEEFNRIYGVLERAQKRIAKR